jgi:hypothetical protein
MHFPNSYAPTYTDDDKKIWVAGRGVEYQFVQEMKLRKIMNTRYGRTYASETAHVGPVTDEIYNRLRGIYVPLDSRVPGLHSYSVYRRVLRRIWAIDSKTRSGETPTGISMPILDVICCARRSANSGLRA